MKKFYIEFGSWGGWDIVAEDLPEAIRKVRALIIAGLDSDIAEKEYEVQEMDWPDP